MTEWRDIPGHPMYQASDTGLIRSLKGREPRLLSLFPNRPHRYLKCTLSGTQARVHTLVALTYLGPCPDGMCIRHLDGDPTNNAVDNLAYGTLCENQADRRNTDTYGQKLSARQAKVIKGLRRCGFTQRRVAEIFSINRTTVSKIDRGIFWSHI